VICCALRIEQGLKPRNFPLALIRNPQAVLQQHQRNG
jgi:hypothetical protein